MASRETPVQKNVMPFEDFLKWSSDRDIEVRYDRFVNDNRYEQRITRLLSSAGGEQKTSSHTEAEKYRSAPARLEKTHNGFSIERNTKAIMNDEPLDSVENHDFVLGPRSNPVRLSRKAAVKRSRTKEKKSATERHDSTMQSTHVRAKTSSNVPVIGITASTPPILRRLSFDQTPNELSFSLSKLSNSPEFEDVPLSPIAGPKPVNSSQPQLPAQEQRSHRPAREEREELMRNQEVEPQQRHVPTTFDQILGEKRIPTALL